MEFAPELQKTQARTKSSRLGLTFFLLSAIGFVLLSSCEQSNEASKNRALQPFTGVPGEILVVMEEDYWNGPAGDSVRSVLMRPYPWILQLEPNFQIFYRRPEDFSAVNRSHRSILLCDIEEVERNHPSHAKQSSDRWAMGQMVYTLNAPDPESFVVLWSQYAEAIAQDITLKDRDRIADYIADNANPRAQQVLKDQLDVGLTMHRDFKSMHVGDDICTFLRERIQHVSGGGYGRDGAGHDVKQGLIVYTYPYTSDTLLSPANLTRKRNEMTAKVIHSINGAPMIVEPRLEPDYTPVEYQNLYALESRGLWKFSSPIKGGNFISLTVVDEEKNRVVTVDGYSFAPNFDKRPLLLQLEALLYSLEI